MVEKTILKCSLCKKVKKREDFHKGNLKNGLNCWCKQCVLRRSKELRARNPQKYRDQNNSWRAKNHERAKEICRESHRKTKLLVITKYGGKCACCDEKEIKFLSIDHKNNDGAADRKKIGGGGIRTYMFLKKNPIDKNKYQVLCFNCNLAQAHHGICPHKLKK